MAGRPASSGLGCSLRAVSGFCPCVGEAVPGRRLGTGPLLGAKNSVCVCVVPAFEAAPHPHLPPSRTSVSHGSSENAI